MFGSAETCIVCNEQMKDKEKYVKYELRAQKNGIGKFNVHKKLDCFEKGSIILKKQIDGSSRHDHTVITTHIAGDKYVFKIIRVKDGFVLAVLWGFPNGQTKTDKQMSEFLKRFIYEKNVVFVYLKNLTGTHEYFIPLLVSRNDPIISTELLQDPSFKEHMAKA